MKKIVGHWALSNQGQDLCSIEVCLPEEHILGLRILSDCMTCCRNFYFCHFYQFFKFSERGLNILDLEHGKFEPVEI